MKFVILGESHACMNIAQKLGIAALIIATVGCGSGPSDPGSAPQGYGDTSDPTVFRYIARETYGALLQGSCEVGPAILRRAISLADDKWAMWRFRNRLQPTDAARHLELARSDVNYAQASDQLGCWMDEDPDFAKMHIKMAERTARAGLAYLNHAAPTLRPVALPDTDPAKAAAFRAGVRSLVERLSPPCVLIGSASNADVLVAARAEAARFRREITGTPFAAHYDLAEVDEAYHRSLSVTECFLPGNESVAQASGVELRATKAALSELRKLL